MKFLSLKLLLVAALLSFMTPGAARGQVGAAPATRPAAADAQAKLNPQQPEDFGAEVYRLVSQQDEIISVLRNGATVIVKRVPSPVVTVRGYVGTGGIYEGRWLGGGLSHLLEHLVAGGSSQRRTEAENRELLQRIGNNSNAYTTYDHTAYFINTTAPHMEEAVDLLTGWLLGALITEDEYRREYEVVQRELEKGKGEPGRQFWYLAQMNRYRANPVRVPVIGYQQVIQGLTRDDVYSYYKLAYQPNNMVFTVAGDIEPEKALKAVQKHLADAAPGREFQRDIPAEPAVLGPRTVVATFPKLGQARVQLAFPSIQLDHPDLYALDLLSAVLSAGESSLLIEEIRDKRKLVTGIDSGSWTPEFVDGTFTITMSLDPDKIAEATAAVLQLIEQVRRDGVDEERVKRAKTLTTVSHVRSKQTAEAIASSMATNFMSTGDPHFDDRYVERIDAVPASAMQEMARKYLDRGAMITTTMLPAEYVGAEGLPRAEDIVRPVAPTTQEKPDEVASEVEKVELDNGTILLVKRISTTPLVVINMYALGGLTAEDAKTNGLGNLTMDLLMRGTTTRSAHEIAEFFDSIGGEMGTDCGNNSWYWNASCLKADFEKTMEVYADIVHNPSFPDDELSAMKARTIAAIESQDADWTAQAFRYFKQVYYGPLDLPYQFLTIGTKENVGSFTPEQLREWYQTKVLRSRRVIAIFGDVDVAQAKALASRYFGKGEKLQQPELKPVAPAPPSNPGAVESKPAVNVTRVEVQPTQQPLAGVVIGFDSRSVIGDPSNFPLAVADTMTSGWGYPTGYLHEVLRGRGLVYVVHAMNSPGRSQEHFGSFVAYAGCDPAKVNDVVEMILENIARVQGTPQDMQPDWFDRSKQLVTISDAMDNETPAEQAATAALDELYGLGYDYHKQFADRINAVAIPDVQSTARGRLSQCVVTISTPKPDLVNVKPGERTYAEFPPVDLTPRGVQHDAGNGGTP